MNKFMLLIRSILLSTLLSFCFFTNIALATTFKIATLSPDGSQWMQIMRQAATEVKTATDGRVKFRFYPGGVMGNDAAVLRKMRLGQLQGAAVPGGALAKFAPETQIYNIPLTFRSFEEVDFIRSQLDSKLMAAFENAGFVNFGLAEGGFAYLMSKKVIADPADLKEKKVWVPADDAASQAAAKTFEIAPVPLALADVLASLQTGLIDTVTSSPIATIALQWHTQVTSITDLPLVYFYGILTVSEKAFSKISASDQQLVRAIMGKAFEKIDKQNRIDNQSALTALTQQGIQLISLDAQQKIAWQDKVSQSVRSFLQQGNIPEANYQELLVSLDKFRQQ